ncbi:tRNA (adenine(58)-N(1))-methyltransferase non-catalytic subunit TRM6-like [Portunus trituberculatus]|uniref:tRNA (adenine(58)-N(1))-methyltransferase non-catalytic subunit TRM6-like n=1 Tax=Portunus trituberculatus TaxID=210409 RepID=UPI001E1CF420|nr:tRNA (adenine(58)-N(1))-methyltransferase non-catalytic subunit TRM6-like [Portunus trituberculatus]
MPLEKNLIEEGSVVMVQKGAYLKTCRVFSGRSYTFGKRGDGQFTLNLDGALGCPFGSTFRMDRVSNKMFSVIKIENPVISLDIVTEGGVDNRDLQDDGRSQKLTPDEIIKLKNKGLTGKEVIQVITENSSTFKDKTIYSQEKYVNKKQKKYGETITIHRPTIRLLNDMYYTQDPLKIANLRIDTLSQLLCHCNVQGGGNFAVFESGSQGLVTAAMLQRMGTTGHLVQVYHGAHPQREAVDFMNFSEEELLVLSFINVTKLPEAAQRDSLTTTTTTTTTTATTTHHHHCRANGHKCKKQMFINEEKTRKEEIPLNSKGDEQEHIKGDSEENLTQKDHENSDSESQENKDQHVNSKKNEEQDQDTQKSGEQTKKPPRPRKFVRTQVEDVSMSSSVLAQGIMGLVVACRQYPNDVVKELMPFLHPGHSFVVFSPYKEPLMELYSEVRALGGTNMRLSETWLRHYQVLPQRTHPAINMSGGGGYLLYGTKVIK